MNGEQVSDVTVVDCSEPHLYEVAAEVNLGGDQLPDQATIESEATCLGTGFNSYVGIAYEESEYDTAYSPLRRTPGMPGTARSPASSPPLMAPR